MIEYRNVEIRFGDFIAIPDLSLTINEGEFFTLLGPSGCGKTTTLRSLVGFIEPSAGTIHMNGENITHKSIEKRNIGMVFQSYALFPTMTVRDNIKFGMKEHHWDKERIDRKVDEVAQIVNLSEEQLDKNISELSGGQQQRVAIARAMSLEPDVICLDEPLSNLDAKLRKQLRNELKRIQRESGTTMIYVTHDQEEALALSDRIAVFNQGKIEQVGTPEEIYFEPATPFVATFIGDRFKVVDSFIQQVQAHNPDVNVNPNKDYYIKTEAIHRRKPDTILTEDQFVVPARMVEEEFLGTTVRREYDVNGTIVPSITFTADTTPATDEHVELIFNHSDMFSFDKEV